MAVTDKMTGGSGGIGAKVAGGLANGAKGMAVALGKRMLSSATDRIGARTERLTDYVSGGAGPGLMSAITGGGKSDGDGDGDGGGGGGGGGGGKGSSLKVTNIVEQLDVGVPVRVAYDQWTRFTDFPTFMKKVESVQQESDEKLNWKAQIFWSHRSWQSTIVEQVPDRRIVWRSECAKGSVDGAVTFHEIGPELTRIVLILEYHPQGFFEKTANLWRAQGRRARLEFKHFGRHVMTEAILHPDDIEGWRGVIHDGQVVPEEEAGGDDESDQGDQGGQPTGQRGDRPGRGNGRDQRDQRDQREQRGQLEQREQRGEQRDQQGSDRPMREGERSARDDGDRRGRPSGPRRREDERGNAPRRRSEGSRPGR